MNNTIIYISIVGVLTILISSSFSSVNGTLTINEKKDLEKKALIEMNLPFVSIDEEKLKSINNRRNIKSFS